MGAKQKPFSRDVEKRVLLVAMSGVRVFDQELLQLGFTLPGFVERSKVIASLPSLGLLRFAAHGAHCGSLCLLPQTACVGNLGHRGRPACQRLAG